MKQISDIEWISNDETIRFLNMDCREFMVNCKNGEFDLNLSDPPYGIGEDGGKNKSRSKLAHSKKYKQYSSGDKKPMDKFFFDEIIRTSKNQIIWGANHFISKMPYDSHCWIVWDKDNGDNDFADCELAWTSFKSSVRIVKYRWSGMLQGNMKNKQKRIHPNEKPISVYRWVLSKYTKPTDVILDCFGGSMSSAIACHMEKRRLIIIELDNNYFKEAIERFSIYEQQLTLF